MKNITKIDLEKLYQNGLTMSEIASHFNTSFSRIQRLFKKLNISVRDKLKISNLITGRNTVLPDKNTLLKLYFNEQISANKIAKQFNTSGRVIRNLLISFNLTPRTSQEATEIKKYRNKQYKISKETLVHLYIGCKFPIITIAKKLNVSRKVIQNRIKEFDIPKQKSIKSRHIKSEKEMQKEKDEKENLNYLYWELEMNNSEIANLLGVVETTISARKKRLGIPSRNATTITDKTRERLRLSSVGKNNRNFGKGVAYKPKRYWILCSNGETKTMRSSWEAKFSMWLEERNLKWLYESRIFIFKDGSSYTPDFYVDFPCGKVWVEVKGYLRMSDVKKIESFKREYPLEKFILADESYLTIIGCDLSRKLDKIGSDKPKKTCLLCNKLFNPRRKTQIFCCMLCFQINRRKLTDEDILAIKELYKNGMSNQSIADKYNISCSHCCHITNNRQKYVTQK